MKRLCIAIGLLICGFGAGRAAHADCAMIDRFDKLHAIQARLARDPDTALFATDIRQIRSISAGIGNRAALDAVEGNGFTGHGVDFLRFLQNTQDLLQNASLDDPHSVRPHFSRQTRANLAAVASHLTRIRCNETQIAVDVAIAAERGGGGNSDAEDLAEVAETLNKLADEVFQIRTLLIALLLAGGLAIVTPTVRHWLRLRRRRAKRHNATYTTHYMSEGRASTGMLVDINCYGTKLNHQSDNPMSIGQLVEVAIGDHLIAGTVMWSNTHYSGVQFRRSITLEEVALVRSTDDAPKTQNGAPKDAA